MCRLFGLTTGSVPVHASFWLLDAPDSLEVESRRNRDGSGIGWFGDDDSPVLDKQPEAAYSNAEWIGAAQHAESSTFVAHVRLATTGARSVENTHPFAMSGRIMAHNGGIGDIERLEARLGAETRALVHGQTDSERYAALITQEVAAHDGDVVAGITAAAGWIAEHLPLSSINLVLAVPGELFALRYPATRALHVIERPSGGASGAQPLDTVTSTQQRIAVPRLSHVPSVVVASERLDDEPGWRMLDAGELVHVHRDLTVTSHLVLADPPRHPAAVSGADPNIDT